MGDTGRRMRSMSVAIGVTAVAAAALSGCTATPDYESVCIDDVTYERVDDDNCEDEYDSGYRWYYYGGGTRLPSVGSKVSGGSTVKPRGSSSGGSSSGGSSDGYSDTGRSSSGGYSDTSGSSSDYGGFGGRSGGVSS